MLNANTDARLLHSASSPTTQWLGQASSQWLMLISDQPIPLFTPLPLELGLHLEAFWMAESRSPSTEANPRSFMFPKVSKAAAATLLFGTYLQPVEDMTFRADLRQGFLLIPSSATPAGTIIKRPIRRAAVSPPGALHPHPGLP